MKLKVKVAIVLNAEEASRMRSLAYNGVASMERDGSTSREISSAKEMLKLYEQVVMHAERINEHVGEANGEMSKI